jgi:hypothetical protein
MAIYEELDEEVVESVEEELESSDAAPDVLTVYLVGIDAFSHVSSQGPAKAQVRYLTQVIDPLMKRLRRSLAERVALADRYVVVTADHGHTEVIHDERHALGVDEDDDPPALLRKAGFRVRPFQLDVKERDFQAVLAYQGAIAYVYVADRSTCPDRGDPCDWTTPPRFEEDVLAAADAFFRNNETGSLVPKLEKTLDLVLARRPAKRGADDVPFQRYVGGGRLEPLGAVAGYPLLSERFADLSAGKYGTVQETSSCSRTTAIGRTRRSATTFLTCTTPGTEVRPARTRRSR